MAADAFLVWFERQQEGRDADCDGIDQCELNGLKRIGRGEEKKEHGNHGGKHRLDEKEGGGALKIVDGAPSLAHDARHAREV